MRIRSFIEKSGPQGTTVVPCFSCAHCNSIVEVPKPNDPTAPMGFCTGCMYPTCTSKKCNEGCTPFMKKIEAAESKARFRASIQ